MKFLQPKKKSLWQLQVILILPTYANRHLGKNERLYRSVIRLFGLNGWTRFLVLLILLTSSGNIERRQLQGQVIFERENDLLDLAFPEI